MKNHLFAVLAAAVLTLPAIASAQQSDTALTRAQVRAELVQLEHAGYNPHRVTVNYPADIQAAETKVHVSSDVTRGASAAVGAEVSADLSGLAQTGS